MSTRHKNISLQLYWLSQWVTYSMELFIVIYCTNAKYLLYFNYFILCRYISTQKEGDLSLRLLLQRWVIFLCMFIILNKITEGHPCVITLMTTIPPIHDQPSLWKNTLHFQKLLFLVKCYARTIHCIARLKIISGKIDFLFWIHTF